jgi:hypothetical protein
MELGYGMFDADNHFYEGHDAFTRHLDPAFAKDVFWVSDDRGHRHLILNGAFWDYIPNPTFDPISVAGSLTDLMTGEKSKAQVQSDGFRIVEPLDRRPEYQNRTARLQRMDAQGVDATLLFPTLVSGVEHQTRKNVPLTYAILEAFNAWILDEWGFGASGRIFATPVLSLADPDRAISNLEWMLDNGARAALVRPAPVPTALGNKSPGDALFDGVWARCAEAGTLVCAHLGESGYYEYAGDWTGRHTFRPFENTGFEQIYADGRAISDFVTAMVVHGAVHRNPGLRVVSVENGSLWVLPLLHRFHKYYRRVPGEFLADPVEDFQRGVWVNPYWEDPMMSLTEFVDVSHLLAGSDFPHAEGLREPADYIKGLGDFADPDQRRIMRDNLKALLAA